MSESPRRSARLPAFLATIVTLVPIAGLGQDLEPRAYSVSPLGTNFVVLSFLNSAGDIAVDPTIPIEDAHSNIHAVALGYFRSANFFGRSASVTLVQPYSWGTAEGRLEGELARIYRSGIADSKVRLAVNLFGAPAMKVEEFVKYRQRTTVGATFSFTVPTGQYDPNKLVNLGTNRWSFKPEIGLSHAFARRWIIDAYGGVAFFTDNPKFLGQIRSQDPLFSTQIHLSYTLRPRLWAALDGTFYAGGQSTVGNLLKDDRAQNVRLGGTISIPLTQHQSLKVSYSAGAIVRIGGNFRTLSVGYQYLWGGKR